MEVIKEPREVAVDMIHLDNTRMEKGTAWDPNPFEGHTRFVADPRVEQRREKFPAGTVRVPTDQPLGDLAVVLLDPSSPDSFFQWGFFVEVMNRIEYIEPYIMDPMAEAMMKEDPALAEEFKRKLESDEAFRKNPRARLAWFYARTPFVDERWQLYPVGVER